MITASTCCLAMMHYEKGRIFFFASMVRKLTCSFISLAGPSTSMAREVASGVGERKCWGTFWESWMTNWNTRQGRSGTERGRGRWKVREGSLSFSAMIRDWGSRTELNRKAYWRGWSHLLLLASQIVALAPTLSLATTLVFIMLHEQTMQPLENSGVR